MMDLWSGKMHNQSQYGGFIGEVIKRLKEVNQIRSSGHRSEVLRPRSCTVMQKAIDEWHLLFHL